MGKHYVRTSLIIGIVVFIISVFVLVAVGSPAPYLGSLVVGFIVWEISFYHLFAKDRDKRNISPGRN
ncbi:hypothetical protein SAMN05216353_10785 [Halobacillus alkaliphilus]|uniref:Uncharacterized protein n=1 Tax=Halobacillus alkaliphilus TaxID=396056 RepID=A0A1I2L445_9BACI|nr:hypothetical protein [Halobacillus alkaliphilus]SFF73643.1 hypothetical protein SAMN05216353_10785 [Halobacillus alkaliphilus]